LEHKVVAIRKLAGALVIGEAEGAAGCGQVLVIGARAVALRIGMVQREKGELVGELRLGIMQNLAQHLAPLFLLASAGRHSQLRIRVEELQTEHIVQRLEAKRLHVDLLVTNLVEAPIGG
jgi:hypothetical protein